MKHNCRFCNKNFETGQKLGGHIISCLKNPKRNILLKNRKKSRPRNLTIKHKQSLALNKTKYLLQHPDKVPYLLNHSSIKSFPEKIFEKMLIDNKITGWKYHFQHGIYQFDFAFPKIKLDVEIDGLTHLQEKVKQIDKRRDEFSVQNGWVVLRFTTKEIRDNIEKCTDLLLNTIKYQTDSKL